MTGYDMFTFAELCELIRVVADTKVGALEVEKDGVRVRIDGIPAPTGAVLTGPPLLPPNLAAASLNRASAGIGVHAAPSSYAPAIPEADEDGLAVVTSPMVGTFYRAPSPGAPSYVNMGDRVVKGQTLCIVEAMKLLNEIEADISGVIARIYPENAQSVEFGERMFAIRPD